MLGTRGCREETKEIKEIEEEEVEEVDTEVVVDRGESVMAVVRMRPNKIPNKIVEDELLLGERVAEAEEQIVEVEEEV